MKYEAYPVLTTNPSAPATVMYSPLKEFVSSVTAPTAKSPYGSRNGTGTYYITSNATVVEIPFKISVDAALYY
jgi:hypothetical protein